MYFTFASSLKDELYKENIGQIIALFYSFELEDTVKCRLKAPNTLIIFFVFVFSSDNDFLDSYSRFQIKTNAMLRLAI